MFLLCLFPTAKLQTHNKRYQDFGKCAQYAKESTNHGAVSKHQQRPEDDFWRARPTIRPSMNYLGKRTFATTLFCTWLPMMQRLKLLGYEYFSLLLDRERLLMGLDCARGRWPSYQQQVLIHIRYSPRARYNYANRIRSRGETVLKRYSLICRPCDSAGKFVIFLCVWVLPLQ